MTSEVKNSETVQQKSEQDTKRSHEKRSAVAIQNRGETRADSNIPVLSNASSKEARQRLYASGPSVKAPPPEPQAGKPEKAQSIVLPYPPMPQQGLPPHGGPPGRHRPPRQEQGQSRGEVVRRGPAGRPPAYAPPPFGRNVVPIRQARPPSRSVRPVPTQFSPSSSGGGFLPAHRENTGIGELMVAIAAATGLDLEKNLMPTVKDGWLLGLRPVRALVQAGILTETVAKQMLAEQVGTIAIEPMSITTEAADVLPLWFCEQHKLVPVALENNMLTVASSRTLMGLLKVEIEEIAQRPVLYRITSDDSISACLAFLSTRHNDEELIETTGEAINESVANWQTLVSEEDADVEISQQVVSLMTRAIAMNASDIHIQTETTEAGTTVVTSHLRRLGDLVKHGTYSPDRGYKLINRLKVAGGFDVDASKPCDGRYDIAVPGSGRYDLRLVGMPLSRGQMLVLRLLPHARKDRLNVSDLFPAEHSDLAERITRIMGQPEGMALVVGSTGSGKSTTLAAMLRPLAQDPALKVVTVEDPVESLIVGAQQVEVTKRLSFPHALRGFLRSDPDVILVGEIRDADTAKMAIQASQTGHMVLSTLHASAVELTPSRLSDMGVPRSILADVLNCVISQRLIKTLCTSCSSGRIDRDPAPRGCSACSDTGWGGRMAIAELMEVNGEVASMIAENAPTNELRKTADIYSYSQYAAKLIDAGITTREAVVRQLGITYDPSFETGFDGDYVGEPFASASSASSNASTNAMSSKASTKSTNAKSPPLNPSPPTPMKIDSIPSR